MGERQGKVISPEKLPVSNLHTQQLKWIFCMAVLSNA